MKANCQNESRAINLLAASFCFKVFFFFLFPSRRLFHYSVRRDSTPVQFFSMYSRHGVLASLHLIFLLNLLLLLVLEFLMSLFFFSLLLRVLFYSRNTFWLAWCQRCSVAAAVNASIGTSRTWLEIMQKLCQSILFDSTAFYGILSENVQTKWSVQAAQLVLGSEQAREGRNAIEQIVKPKRKQSSNIWCTQNNKDQCAIIRSATKIERIRSASTNWWWWPAQ